MPREDHVAKSWDFLKKKEAASATFTFDEFVQATGWRPKTAEIYLNNKKLTEITERLDDGTYRVLGRINNVALEDYRALFPQARSLFGSYNSACYTDVLIYDFFMPLTHERKLRQALDSLFYADCVQQRVRAIGANTIREELADASLSYADDEALVDWVSKLVGDVFVGYSISHVNGRFRVGDLKPRTDAAELLADGGSYLVDETTAVVRFIMRCPSSRQATGPSEQVLLDFSDVDEERQQIQWVISRIFADAVVTTVQGEEEIWLLEQGERPLLWVWEKRQH